MKKSVMHTLLAGLALAFLGISPNASATVTNTEEELAGKIDAWTKQHSFNGVIAVRPAGEPARVRAFGIADKRTGRALTTDTVFQAGSISKYFAAVAAFAMAEQGLVDLDAPISTYLPDYRADTGAKLTLAHLLSSGSGLPNDISPVVNGIPAELRATPGATLESLGYADMSLAEGVKRYASGDLEFPPGTAFDYSNSNWPLVHLILERIAGQPFSKVLQRFVFRPAGMTSSGAFVVDMNNATPPQEDFAIGYDAADEKHDGDYPLPAFAGGGMYTNAADLIALEDALRAGRLFGPERLERFRTVQHAEEGYAFGGRFADVELGGKQRKVSLKSGSNGATKVTLVYDTTTSNAIVLLTNMPGGQDSMFDLSGALLEEMYGE